ncbi:MAG: putative DNA-binding domain-containing protein [Proteobacteria bacterium]|nr:putative DNA-binding domain-containing protein [Pseudomonadota bacterium]
MSTETMKQLHKYQESFYKAIFTNKPPLLQDAIGEVEEFNERFNIYSNNVFSSLKNVLKDDFPLCRKILGEQKFNQVTFEFVRNFPPESGCLLAYGQKFSRFLEVFFPALPYLKDISQLEWAKKEIYYREDSIPLDPQIISTTPEDKYEALTFKFPEATFFSESSFSLQEIWEDFEKEKEKVKAPKTIPSYSLIIRPRFQVKHDWLKAEEFCFLKKLYEGKPLGEAFEKATHINPDFNLSETLGIALTREYFTRVEVSHEN